MSYEKTTLYRIGSLRHSNAQMYDLDQFKWSNEDINVLGVTIAHEDIVRKNYDPILAKAKKVLEGWYNRGLSLIGKVQVVNTLVASLFVYKMMALPIVPVGVVKNMENLIRDFLWKGKKAKISLKILQLPVDQGGLKLVDLKAKDKALKATWPQILTGEEDYAKMVYKIMRCSALGHDIWRCSIDPRDVGSLGIKNQFWQDLLVSWSSYNYYVDRRIENQLLWYNSRIKVRNRSIFWRDAYQKGLVYVYQLFEQGDFKTDEKIYLEYGLTSLRYNSLKTSIPMEWKIFCKENPAQSILPLVPHNFDRCICGNIRNLSQKVYTYLLDDAMIIHYKFIKWRQELGEEYEDTLTDFAKRHKDIYRVTNIAKYRSFQYRLLQRGIITNIQLYTWGIAPSDQCSFCKKERETVIHLLVECEKVKSLWESVKEYIGQRFPGVKVVLTPTNILMNTICQDNKAHVVNFLCLLVKQFVYRQRCMSKEIHLPMLLQHIKQTESIERYVAKKNGKESKHYSKWCIREEPGERVVFGDMEQHIGEYTVEYIYNIGEQFGE